MLTPAYAMNEANAGSGPRDCATCGDTFNAGKTSNLAKCTPCLRTEGCAPCRRCATTGRFITGTTNGVPTGPGGDCYRCGGKGYQTRKDERRNDYYDAHRPVYL